MSDPWVVVLVTALLIGASAFFVAVEFALIGARRHRLEDRAAHSASARAASASAVCRIDAASRRAASSIAPDLRWASRTTASACCCAATTSCSPSARAMLTCSPT